MLCKPYLKNWTNIQEKIRQEYSCLFLASSFTPQHSQFGVQVTTYLRLSDQSSTQEVLIESMEKNAIEMYTLGYDTHFLIDAR